MFRTSLIAKAITDLANSIRRLTAKRRAADAIARSESSHGYRPPVYVDLVELRRLREEGLSEKRIAWRLKCSQPTIHRRLQALTPQVQCKATEPIRATQPEAKPSDAVQTLFSVPAQSAEPAPAIPVNSPAVFEKTPEPPIYGLESIPEGCKDLFLVRGSTNCDYCRGYRPFVQAVGVDVWDPRFGRLDMFRNATRLWIVISTDAENSPAENAKFLNSIRRDSGFAARCVVSNHGVRHVAKQRYWNMRNAGAALSMEKPMLDELTERTLGFRPLAQMGAEEIAALCDWTPSEQPTNLGYTEPWQLGGSSGSR